MAPRTRPRKPPFEAVKLESTLPARTGPLYVAPTLDVLLLLLIFFLLGSGFVLRSGVAVQLPVLQSTLPPVSRSHLLTLSPGDTPRLYLNESPVTLEELPDRLGKPDERIRQVIVLADRSTPFGLVSQVTNVALRAGFQIVHATAGEERN